MKEHPTLTLPKKTAFLGREYGKSVYVCMLCTLFGYLGGGEFVFSEGKREQKKTNAGAPNRSTTYTTYTRTRGGFFMADFSPAEALFLSFYVFYVYICMLIMRGRTILGSEALFWRRVCMSVYVSKGRHTQRTQIGAFGALER